MRYFSVSVVYMFFKKNVYTHDAKINYNYYLNNDNNDKSYLILIYNSLNATNGSETYCLHTDKG